MNKTQHRNIAAAQADSAKKRTTVMLIALAIAVVIVVAMVWLAVKAIVLHPETVNTDSIAGKPVTVELNAAPGAESYENMRFCTLFNMTLDPERSNDERAYYADKSSSVSMMITSVTIQSAYKQLDSFSELRSSKDLADNIALVRYAFSQDISSINVLSPMNRVKFASEIRKIRFAYAPSNDLTYAEINGNLYGCMCYNCEKGICVMDIVSPDGEMYSVEIALLNKTLEMSEIMRFLQSVAFV